MRRGDTGGESWADRCGGVRRPDGGHSPFRRFGVFCCERSELCPSDAVLLVEREAIEIRELVAEAVGEEVWGTESSERAEASRLLLVLAAGNASRRAMRSSSAAVARQCSQLRLGSAYPGRLRSWWACRCCAPCARVSRMDAIQT